MVDDDEATAIVTEALLPGDLRGRIVIAFPAALDLAKGVASALSYSHRLGIVHRNVRPETIRFAPSGAVKLVDFGMAHVDDLVGLTTSTLFAASSHYLAPEVAEGITGDPRSDLYSLGVSLYESLVGAPPVIGPGGVVAEEELLRRLGEIDGVPSSFAHVVAALTRPLDERLESADRLGELLASGHRPPERAMRWCIHCRSTTPSELPVCIHCGRTEPDLRRAESGEGESLILRRLSEDDTIFNDFQFILRCLSGDPELRADILTGDIRMYSREERKRGLRLPVRIVDDLTPASIATLIWLLERSGSKNIGVYRRRTGDLRSRERRGPIITLRSRPELSSEEMSALKRQLETVRLFSKSPDGPGAPADKQITPAKPDPGAGLLAEIVASLHRLRAAIAGAGGGGFVSDEAERVFEHARSLVEECASIRNMLDSVRLGEIYGELHRLDRQIERSDSPSETERLIRLKGDLLENYERYRERERRLAGLIERTSAIRGAIDRATEHVERTGESSELWDEILAREDAP